MCSIDESKFLKELKKNLEQQTQSFYNTLCSVSYLLSYWWATVQVACAANAEYEVTQKLQNDFCPNVTQSSLNMKCESSFSSLILLGNSVRFSMLMDGLLLCRQRLWIEDGFLDID